MSALGTLLFLVISIVFLAVGHIFMVRLREAEGSLRLAKISVALTAFSAAGAFYMNTISQLVYDPSGSEDLLIKQLYVPMNLFAMLVLAFLASFAVFAAYRGGRRKLVLLLIFVVALIPTAYVTLTYDQAGVTPAPADIPENYLLITPLPAMILFALCGIPLGVIPLVAFGRSLMMARRKGDKVLSHNVVMMFSAVLLNEAAYLMFVFGPVILRFVVLVAWIPILFFLLFAVIKITRPVEART